MDRHRRSAAGATGDAPLRAALERAQQAGMVGPGPIDEAIAHARRFVSALDGVTGRVVDLGSGGGLPGLVVAWDRPDLEVVLVDRRQSRTDALRRAVRALDLHVDQRVTVRTVDAEALARDEPGRAQAVTARGFGPPEPTLRVAAALTAPGGRVVVSDPPGVDRWSPELVAELGLHHTRQPGMSVFVRSPPSRST